MWAENVLCLVLRKIPGTCRRGIYQAVSGYKKDLRIVSVLIYESREVSLSGISQLFYYILKFGPCRILNCIWT